MQPKKVKIEGFISSPECKFSSQRISAAFLLMSKSKGLLEDAEEALNKHGLTIGTIKKELGLAEKHYQRFNHLLKECCNHGSKENYMAFFEDFEELDGIVEKFLDLKSNNEDGQ